MLERSTQGKAQLRKKAISLREAQNYLRVNYICFCNRRVFLLHLIMKMCSNKKRLFSNKGNIIHSKYKIFYNGEIKTIKFMFTLFTLHSAIQKF